MQKLALSHFPLAQHQQASEASVGQFSLCPTLGSLVSVPSCALAGAVLTQPGRPKEPAQAWVPMAASPRDSNGEGAHERMGEQTNSCGKRGLC